MKNVKVLVLFVFLMIIGINNCFGVSNSNIRTYEYASENNKIKIVCYVQYGISESNCTLTYDDSTFKSSISSFQLNDMNFASADNLFLKVKKDSDNKFKILEILTKRDVDSCTENGKNICYNYKTIEQDLEYNINAYCRYSNNKVNVNCAINDKEKSVSCNVDGTYPFTSAENIKLDYNLFKNGCPSDSNVYLKVDDNSYPLKITNISIGNPANICRDNGGTDKCFSISTLSEDINACEYKSSTGMVNIICTYNKHKGEKVQCSELYKSPFIKGSTSNDNYLELSSFINKCPNDLYIKATSSGNSIKVNGLYTGTPADQCRVNGGEIICYSINSIENTFKSEITSYENQVQENDSSSDPDGDIIGTNFDADHFCKGPVQGVFTTLGWIFFALKIIVPLLLIIMGSVDFGKAVLSSKDDEIKKSAKTLAMRAVIGILIFFVPTILNLVINVIDSSKDNDASNVYKGTFWDCTRCMLDPNASCTTLNSKTNNK